MSKKSLLLLTGLVVLLTVPTVALVTGGFFGSDEGTVALGEKFQLQQGDKISIRGTGLTIQQDRLVKEIAVVLDACGWGCNEQGTFYRCRITATLNDKDRVSSELNWDPFDYVPRERSAKVGDYTIRLFDISESKEACIFLVEQR